MPITYADKELYEDKPLIPIEKKFRYQDANEIKNVVNALEALVQSGAVALVDGATIDLTSAKHTLATSSATRTFTISYTGDDITIEVTLSALTSIFTFPAGSLCMFNGDPSEDNTCTLVGVSGDKYLIGIKKIGSAYYVIATNMKQ